MPRLTQEGAHRKLARFLTETCGMTSGDLEEVRETYGTYAVVAIFPEGTDDARRFYQRNAEAIWLTLIGEAYDAGTTLWEQLVTISEWAGEERGIKPDSRFPLSYDELIQHVTAWAFWVAARNALERKGR